MGILSPRKLSGLTIEQIKGVKMNKPEWTMTTADFNKAEEKGIEDYDNHKMHNNKRVSLYRCKWDAIEIAARNKLLKYLSSQCTIHPNLLGEKYKVKAHCTMCMIDIRDYIKEEK